MSFIELNERIQLSIHAICLASSSLGDIDDSESEEIRQYRDELTRLMHEGCRLADQNRKASALTLVE
mgnify:CR=1 FL=1